MLGPGKCWSKLMFSRPCLLKRLLAFLLGYGYSSYSSGCVCIFSLRRGSKRRGQLSKR